MKEQLTAIEANTFKNAGFKIQKETIIKRKESVENIIDLTEGVAAKNLEGKQTFASEFVVFNVLDRHDTLIFTEEEEDDLIAGIKDLVSPLV